MAGELSASMMCVNFLDLRNDLLQLQSAGIEYLHFDIMDGKFVPNYTLGTCVLDQIRNQTEIPFDLHMMVEHPEDKLDYFNIRQGDLVSVHYESTYHLQRLLAKIKKMGAHPGVAINPATPVSSITDVLDDLDFVLIMTVNPGFAGQSLIPHSLKKIAEAKRFLSDNACPHIKIQVDGNVNFENARRMREAGADIFVVGSSGLFLKTMTIFEAALELRKCIAYEYKKNVNQWQYKKDVV